MTMQYVPAPLSCFSCGQVDAVRKVSSLVSQGVTTGTSHGTAVTGTAYSGGGSSLGVTGVNMSSVHMTGQAQMLMPPAAPRPLMKWTWWIVGGVVLGLIAGSILSSATANLSYSLSSIGWLIGFGANARLVHLSGQSAGQEAETTRDYERKPRGMPRCIAGINSFTARAATTCSIRKTRAVSSPPSARSTPTSIAKSDTLKTGSPFVTMGLFFICLKRKVALYWRVRQYSLACVSPQSSR